MCEEMSGFEFKVSFLDEDERFLENVTIKMEVPVTYLYIIPLLI